MLRNKIDKTAQSIPSERHPEAHKRRKRFAAAAIALSTAAALGLLAGCADGSGGLAATDADTGNSDNVIKVGASPTPHAEILNDAVAPLLEEEGYTLEVVEFNDYILPNKAVESGDVIANYFQHQPYLDDYNAENGTDLVSIEAVHYEPFGIYGGKSSSLEDIQDGATIAIPNDTTNEARALLLLEQEGLIKLKDGAGITATIADIEENPKNLDIRELEAAQIPRSLSDVDFAAINANYAVEAGLTPTEDALAVESADGDAAQTYANVLVVNAGNENDPAIQALAKALLSDEVRTYIENTFKGAVLPIF